MEKLKSLWTWIRNIPVQEVAKKLWAPVRNIPVQEVAKNRLAACTKVREFNYLTWNYLVRPGASLLAGILLVLLLQCGLLLLGVNPLGWYMTFLVTGVLVAFFTLPEQSDPDTFELVVPETRFAAQLLWFGMPLPWRLVTSTYPWLGKRLGFNYSKRVSEPFTDQNGFILMGDIQFRVWDASDAAVNSKQRVLISAPAKNESEIKAALTLVLTVSDPRKMLHSNQPALDLGDRARQEFRELVTRFVDTDVPKLHSVLGKLFVGETLITCFTGKAIAGHKAGSMIRNKSGEVMFTLKETGESDEEAANRFVREVEREADEAMKKAIVVKVNGENNVRTEAIAVSNPIKEVLDAIGCVLHRVSFADIEFSDKVKEAADLASAEQNERIAQLGSAATIKEVRKTLMPDEDEVNNPGYELATIIAAAQDDKKGNIKIIMVPGGNSITQAAVVGANQIGGGS